MLDIALTGNAGFVPDVEITAVTAATEEIELQLQPVTVDDTALTGEDIAIIIDVLANDSDPENEISRRELLFVALVFMFLKNGG